MENESFAPKVQNPLSPAWREKPSENRFRVKVRRLLLVTASRKNCEIEETKLIGVVLRVLQVPATTEEHFQISAGVKIAPSEHAEQSSIMKNFFGEIRRRRWRLSSAFKVKTVS